LDKANRDSGNISGLNLAAVKHATVQVNRMLLQQELLIIGMIICTERDLAEALYMLYRYILIHLITCNTQIVHTDKRRITAD
jgi:hypothetical protein